jgi:hypothetical protein
MTEWLGKHAEEIRKRKWGEQKGGKKKVQVTALVCFNKQAHND